jgi:hypothetical protein
MGGGSTPAVDHTLADKRVWDSSGRITSATWGQPVSDELDRNQSPRHRAAYILECGTWRATCRICGWSAADPQRRQAATLFRLHIRDSRTIDLTEPVAAERSEVRTWYPPYESSIVGRALAE